MAEYRVLVPRTGRLDIGRKTGLRHRAANAKSLTKELSMERQDSRRRDGERQGGEGLTPQVGGSAPRDLSANDCYPAPFPPFTLRPLSAQLRRPTPRSATAALRRYATLNRSQGTPAQGRIRLESDSLRSNLLPCAAGAHCREGEMICVAEKRK